MGCGWRDRNGVWVGSRPFHKPVVLTMPSTALPTAHAASTLLPLVGGIPMGSKTQFSQWGSVRHPPSNRRVLTPLSPRGLTASLFSHPQVDLAKSLDLGRKQKTKTQTRLLHGRQKTPPGFCKKPLMLSDSQNRAHLGTQGWAFVRGWNTASLTLRFC